MRPDRRRGRARWLLLGLAGGAVLADQTTKQLAVEQLAGAEPVRLLGGTVYLVYATNSGAAFSLGSSLTWVFPLIALVVLGWIGWLTLRLRAPLWAVGLGLVAGGALGNLIDRLARPPAPFQGEVVDMISVFSPDGRIWPVFNLADSVLVLGMALVVWLELTGRHRDGSRVTSSGAAASDPTASDPAGSGPES